MVFDLNRLFCNGSNKDAVVAGVYDSQPDNGYSKGNVYWFKYEPIEWRVLDPKTGYIMSEFLLDAQAINYIISRKGDDYYIENGKYASDYATSEVRQWLTNDFYNAAFSSSQKKLMTQTKLVNYGYITKYNSEQTYDYVFCRLTLICRNRSTDSIRMQTVKQKAPITLSVKDLQFQRQLRDMAILSGFYVMPVNLRFICVE